MSLVRRGEDAFDDNPVEIARYESGGSFSVGVVAAVLVGPVATQPGQGLTPTNPLVERRSPATVALLLGGAAFALAALAVTVIGWNPAGA